MRKLLPTFLYDGVWSKVVGLTAILFFVLLADAILSDWVPVYMQTVLGSSLLMGLVMSFSSIVGFGADMIFPQLLKGTTVKKLIVMSVMAGMLFSGLLLTTLYIPRQSLIPILVLLLVGMTIWGIYYEFLGFASQQFVAETAGVHQRASVWAVMGIFRSLAYFLGPILGGYLATQGDWSVVMTAGVISVFAYALLFLFRVKNRPVVVEVSEINLIKEMSHWRVLLVHVWPVLLASFMLGLVDATFWTTGTVFTEILAKDNWWGGMFLPMYTLPSLFVGWIVLKWGIYQGKKKWAEVFMLLGGIMLALLSYQNSVFYALAIVFLSSVMLSISYPLIDAVYSDIVSRMGHERKHLVGLSSSMISLAYIVGPILSGFIASRVGERLTFVVIGIVMVIVSVFLLFTTPRKLKLPQKEIATWG